MLHDEMSIKSDLVYDPRSGELVGFIRRDGEGTCLPSEQDELATHVLVFYVAGINSKLGMSLGFFPTKNATASMLFPLLWKAVGWLESVCGLKVEYSRSGKCFQLLIRSVLSGHCLNC